MEDRMSHVNETSLIAQAYDTVLRMDFTTSFVSSSIDLVIPLRLICGYIGSTDLMKAMKSGRSPCCKGRFSHAHSFAMDFIHS